MRMNTKHASNSAIFRIALQQYGIIVLFGVTIVVMSLLIPGYLKTGSLSEILRQAVVILRQATVVGIISIGMTFVIASSSFDLSVGAVFALCAAMLFHFIDAIPWPLAICLVLFIALIIGVINGLLVVKLKVSSVLITFASMAILRGAVYVYTAGAASTKLRGMPPGLRNLGWKSIGPIPLPVIMFLALAAVAHVVLTRTTLGRNLLAIGFNRTLSNLVGLPTERYRIIVFAVSALLASAASVFYIARLATITPTAGQGYELDAIAAVLVGGATIRGGYGSIPRTILGVILITILGNYLDFMGLSPHIQYLVKGGIILLAIALGRLAGTPSQLRHLLTD